VPPPAAAPAPAGATAQAKAPPGAPASTADVFAAVLAASAQAAESPPPTQGQGPSARTAIAEGVPAGGDYSGPDKTEGDDQQLVALPQSLDGSPAPALTALLAAAFAPAAQGPRPQPQPVEHEPKDEPAMKQLSTSPVSAAPAQVAPLQEETAATSSVPAEHDAATTDVAPRGPHFDSTRPTTVPAKPKVAPAKPETGAQAEVAPAEPEVAPAKPPMDEPKLPPAQTQAHAPAERPTEASQPAAGAQLAPQGQSPEHDRPHEQTQGHARPHRGEQVQSSQLDPAGKPAPEIASATPVEPRVAPEPAAEPTRPERPVRLNELAAAARATIRVTARESRTTAHISLKPEALGRVEIHLRYEAGGVTAQVTADSAAAAGILTASSGELRRTLEAQGLTVLGLDVHQGGLDLGTTPDRDRLGSPEAKALPREPGADDEAEETTIKASSLPLAGSQVDVLA
jgi:flagellar hook-length control protein FliK